MIDANIEIIEDNAGGLTIQNTETKAVVHFANKHTHPAIESLKAIQHGEDMVGWDLSEPECFISDEEYQKHALNGGFRIWDKEELYAWLYFQV